jgi:hypothetical protein
MHDEA